MREDVLSQGRYEVGSTDDCRGVDDCHGAHTYGSGCYYNADDPKRPVFPAELRPGVRLTAESRPRAA